MTTEKPDPAALIEEFLDEYECGVHPASRKHLAQKLAAKIAAIQPQGPTTDDAAEMLDEVEEALAEYQVASDGERSEARERWRTARAAVLARMSTPEGYALVPKKWPEHVAAKLCLALDAFAMGNSQANRTYAEIIALAAAPTEVK